MIKLIQGGIFEDNRGVLRFVNEFEFKEVLRFYSILQTDTAIIRAWQGHRIETKWFFVASGSFELRFIKLVDWESKSENIIQEKYILNSQSTEILEVPGGYLNGFRAIELGSVLMVYSNLSVEASKEDDYRCSLEEIPWLEETNIPNSLHASRFNRK